MEKHSCESNEKSNVNERLPSAFDHSDVVEDGANQQGNVCDAD